MFFNIFKKNRRKDLRIDMRAKVCVINFIRYDEKSDDLVLGDCDIFNMINIGTSGISIQHDGSLKKGDIVEVRTRHAIEDRACLKCKKFNVVTDELPLHAIIGKVIWRNNSLAGLSFAMLHPEDKKYLTKICSQAEQSKHS